MTSIGNGNSADKDESSVVKTDKVFLTPNHVKSLLDNTLAMNQLDKDFQSTVVAFQQRQRILQQEQTILVLEMKLELGVPRDWVLQQDEAVQERVWFEKAGLKETGQEASKPGEVCQEAVYVDNENDVHSKRRQIIQNVLNNLPVENNGTDSDTEIATGKQLREERRQRAKA